MTGHIPIINPDRHEQGGRLYAGQPLYVAAASTWLDRQPHPLVSVDRMAEVEMVNPRHWRLAAALREMRGRSR